MGLDELVQELDPRSSESSYHFLDKTGTNRWENRKLGDIIDLVYGSGLSKEVRTPGCYPVYGSNGIVGYHEKSLVEGPGIIVGRKGSIGKVIWCNEDFWPIDTTYYIERKTHLDLKWIYYKLLSLNLEKLNSATGIPGLNRSDVFSLNVKVPTILEQRKIAAILSTVDAAIEQTDAVIAQTERMKKGLMQELFAKKFDIAKLGDCSFKPEYGYTTSAIFQPVGPKFIRITDLKDDGVDWASVPHCTCDEYVLKKYLLKPGDIIFARIGATTGKNYLIKENINCIFASYLIRIRCKDMLLPDFLYQFLKTSAYWNQINANKSGRLKEGINIPLLNGILIPLPSIQEQKKISLILSSIDERLDGERKYRERLKKLKLGLMQDLLTGRVPVKVDGHA